MVCNMTIVIASVESPYRTLRSCTTMFQGIRYNMCHGHLEVMMYGLLFLLDIRALCIASLYRFNE